MIFGHDGPLRAVNISTLVGINYTVQYEFEKKYCKEEKKYLTELVHSFQGVRIRLSDLELAVFLSCDDWMAC